MTTLFPKATRILSYSRLLWQNLQMRRNYNVNSQCCLNKKQTSTYYWVINYTQFREMAGHSKWQNIRHTKSAKDSARSAFNSKIANRIRIAVQEGASADPKFNVHLARVISEAKSKDVPNTTIDSAVKAASSSKDVGSVIAIEATGPGGCMLIIEAFTSKATKTRADVNGILKRAGGKIGNVGTAMHSFEKKGVVWATCQDAIDVADLDTYVEAAIESGAEEVNIDKDEDDQSVLIFLCEPNDLAAVRNELEVRNYQVQSAGVEYLPIHSIPLSDMELEVTEILSQKLMKNGDVMKIYDNIAVPES